MSQTFVIVQPRFTPPLTMDTVSFVRNGLRKFKTFSYWLLYMWRVLVFLSLPADDMIGPTGLTSSGTMVLYIHLPHRQDNPSLTATLIGTPTDPNNWIQGALSSSSPFHSFPNCPVRHLQLLLPDFLLYAHAIASSSDQQM